MKTKKQLDKELLRYLLSKKPPNFIEKYLNALKKRITNEAKNWSKSDVIAFLSLMLTVIGLLSTLLVPEFRIALGLEKLSNNPDDFIKSHSSFVLPGCPAPRYTILGGIFNPAIVSENYMLSIASKDKISAEPFVKKDTTTGSMRILMQYIENRNVDVRIENFTKMSIDKSQVVPDKIDVVAWEPGGCAGGFNSDFADSSINSHIRQWTTRSKEADFFTAHPGENLAFWFYFDCQTPGIFSLSTTFYISRNGTNIVYTVPSDNWLVCSKSIKIWWKPYGDNKYKLVQEAEWDGKKYVIKHY